MAVYQQKQLELFLGRCILLSMPGTLLSVGLLAATASTTVYFGALVGGDDKTSPVAELLEEDGGAQELTICQAFTFPLYASATLLVLYFFFGYVQYFLIAFLVFGASTSLYYLLIAAIKRYSTLSISWNNKIAILMTGLVVLEWIRSGNFICHDILGCSLCVLFICTLRFPSLKVATLCLSLLLLYDVFWVFFSEYIFSKNVMVEVATKNAVNPIQQIGEKLQIAQLKQLSRTLELPLKLIFPSFLADGKSLMLGLGDIALPGALVALARRSELLFDSIMDAKLLDLELQLSTAAKTMMHPTVTKSYLFHYAFGGYVIGLIGAFVGNILSGHAQPALIYLVPGVLLPLVLRAYHIGKLSDLWIGKTEDSTV